MKRIACYAALTAVSLFPCLPAFAQDYSGRTLVVGTWGGDIERLLKEHVAGPLEAKTGAKVEFLLGGSGDRLSKMVAERNNPTMDVTFQNIYEAPAALKEGLVVAPDATLVPAAADVWAGMNDGCYAMSLVGLGIAYSKAVFPEAPEWADLWNPELKGKMAYAPYPSSEGDGMLARLGHERRIAVSVPDYSIIPQLLPGTSYAFTVGRRYAEHVTASGRLKTLLLPEELGVMAFYLLWHERSQSSRFHRWLRETIRRLVRDRDVLAVPGSDL